MQNLTTLIDLALYDLDCLGLWQEAEIAESKWIHGEAFPLPQHIVDRIPLFVQQEVQQINSLIGG